MPSKAGKKGYEQTSEENKELLLLLYMMKI